MDIHEALLKIKNDFELAITTSSYNGVHHANGSKAKTALIRSQKLINVIHEVVKKDFIECGIPQDQIFPTLESTNSETTIKGFLKSKKQDITLFKDINQRLLSDTDDLGNEKILSVNVRSQLSSLAKNIDTLYERTFAESLNLHLKYPRQCLGEVYLIPTNEYDAREMEGNKVVYKGVSNIENYIRIFQAINNRLQIDKDEYKYERVCLLIVDFRQDTPKLYETVDDLKNDNLLNEDSTVTLDHLIFQNFARDLLTIYNERFDEDKII